MLHSTSVAQIFGPGHNSEEIGNDRSYREGSSLNISTSSSCPLRKQDAAFNSASRLSKRRALQCSWVQEPSVERNNPDDFSRISLCTVTASLHCSYRGVKSKACHLVIFRRAPTADVRWRPTAVAAECVTAEALLRRDSCILWARQSQPNQTIRADEENPQRSCAG